MRLCFRYKQIAFPVIGACCAVLGGIGSTLSGGTPWFKVLYQSADAAMLAAIVYVMFVITPFFLAALVSSIPKYGSLTSYIAMFTMSVGYVFGFTVDVGADPLAGVALFVVPLFAFAILFGLLLLFWLANQVHDARNAFNQDND